MVFLPDENFEGFKNKIATLACDCSDCQLLSKDNGFFLQEEALVSVLYLTCGCLGVLVG